MDKLEADVKLLMDHMYKTECRYFIGDEEECNRPGNDAFNRRCKADFIPHHIACNCYGDIRECDFPLEHL